MRVRVCAAPRHEHGDRAGMPLLQRGLRDAGVITVVLHELVLERRVVARVAEDDRLKRSIVANHPKHGH